MANPNDQDSVTSQQRDQMLKLVTKAFYNELVNYGVRREEIARVASHLLDNMLAQQERTQRSDAGSLQRAPLTVGAVIDEWKAHRRLTIDKVTLRPLETSVIPRVLEWLRAPVARDSFVSAFPDTEAGLAQYFERPQQSYFGIHHEGQLVGMVGGDNIDAASGKLEMKKLVGESKLRGKGIGKRATFGFLYYAFMILDVHKVYIHSRDINMRNISLNSGFGFEVEGVFLEDIQVGSRRADVVRMALLKPIWTALFDV